MYFSQTKKENFAQVVY